MIRFVSRRASLLGAATLLAASRARAQPKAAIAVRIDRDVEVLDPAFRSGLQDGNIVRAVFQRLYTVVPGGDLVPDAASALEQTSPTTVEFTLKPGQMFTGNYGEMTAEDVKFSFERFAVAPVNGTDSPYKGDWINLKGVEVTGKYTGIITMEKPRASLMAIAIGDVSGSIVCKKAVLELGAAHNTKPVGSGPMIVDTFEKQRGVSKQVQPTSASVATTPLRALNVTVSFVSVVTWMLDSSVDSSVDSSLDPSVFQPHRAATERDLKVIGRQPLKPSRH